jgi:hypothetical protein
MADHKYERDTGDVELQDDVEIIELDDASLWGNVLLGDNNCGCQPQ